MFRSWGSFVSWKENCIVVSILLPIGGYEVRMFKRGKSISKTFNG
jgi:hypothetical protein